MIKFKTKSLNLASYIWMYSGIAVFILGYLKWYLSCPLLILIAAAFFFSFRKRDSEVFEIDKKLFVGVCIIIPIWMLVCGFCGIFRQAPDWAGRNAQLYDLVTRSWPVYYSDGSAYTYYLGHFMIPALFGKLFGLHAAKIALWLYTSFAVLLTYLFAVKITGANTYKKQIIVLLIFMFFSCGETMRELAINISNGIVKHFNPSYSPGSYNVYITSNPIAYAWVFNQMTIAFLGIVMLFDNDGRVEDAAFLALPFVLFAPFPLVSFSLLAVTMVIKHLITHRNSLGSAFMKIISVQNITAIILLPVFILYLWGNVSGEKPDELGFQVLNYSGNIHIYVMIVVFEFLLYVACIWKKFKTNPYLYICVAFMMIFPFFRFGLYNDLCSRATGVGSFVLMLFIIQFFFETDSKTAPRLLKTVLAALVMISSVRSAVLYQDIINDTVDSWSDGTVTLNEYDVIHTYEDVERLNIVDYSYNYFTFNAKDDFFYKYLAKQPK